MQFVQLLCGTLSNERLVTCGVPQDSVAGPWRFFNYINYLSNTTEFFTILFADDTTFQITSDDSNFAVYKAY